MLKNSIGEKMSEKRTFKKIPSKTIKNQESLQIKKIFFFEKSILRIFCEFLKTRCFSKK